MRSTLAVLTVAALAATVTALDNGLARTPPMGWLSWERFRCQTDCTTYPDTCISENLYMAMADHMVSDGYRDAGYEYVNIDDCWAEKERDAQGRLVADKQRFPHGIKWLADYMHQRGLKLGIYGDYGTHTCGGYPGSLGYLQTDAQTFADWGVDSLKLDGCYANLSTMPEGYGNMSRYMNETVRPMLFSCSYPAYYQGNLFINYTYVGEICNLWRLYGDIQDDWGSVSSIINFWGDHQEELVPAAAPGRVNDPDMLIIGDTALANEAMCQTQMALWSIFAAPMYMSNDLRNMSDFATRTLLNTEVIAVNQDKAVIQGSRVELSVGQAWHRPLANGDIALVLFNPDQKNERTITAPLDLVGVPSGSAHARDLFEHKDDGVVTTAVVATVPSLGVKMWRLTPQ